jgi:hypothetical protein
VLEAVMPAVIGECFEAFDDQIDASENSRGATVGTSGWLDST